ncbi:MAG: UDP-3-O-(3-hydroxymyristoyl)glucosamine N-acyltransferase [Bacteroidetes bacterium]|jgi:UDP-3-O-[3-hydroxymyristoyl] glucosamine N-acyltransferase|nr:UDP-3-O-(3-hydroxymyristoyl)glucosamine N-acyltransferase [Bacteroidota bacterium]
MKLKEPVSIRAIAQLIGAELIGPDNGMLLGINEIHKVEPGDLTFVDVAKYYEKALTSQASFIIINQRMVPPEGKVLLLHEKPFEAYNGLIARYYRVHHSFEPDRAVASSAQVHPSAVLHQGVVVGCDVTIGAHTVVFPNVVIYDNVHIGSHVIIHAGTVIGGQAFYYSRQQGYYKKWHSCGSVIIENHVEIGSSCTIDKGVSGITRIGEGTKLDNQVHVGHGVVIGKHCLFAAQCAIGGKTTIEDGVVAWGQVGIVKNVTIGKGAVLGAQCGVSKSLEGGKAYYGSPARELRVAQRELAALRKLPSWVHE